VALYPLFGILMIAERGYSIIGGGEAGSITAGAIASSLIGVVYLWPVGFAASRRFDNRLLVIIVGSAIVILTVAIVAFPAMLAFGTAIFVLAISGASAIGLTKAIRYYFSRHGRS
jgi:hypothetical protein